MDDDARGASQISTWIRSPGAMVVQATQAPRDQQQTAEQEQRAADRGGPAHVDSGVETVSRATHLVCSTPGRLGAMIRAG